MEEIAPLTFGGAFPYIRIERQEREKLNGWNESRNE